MTDKETTIRCLTKYFGDSTCIFLYGSKVYSGNSKESDADAVVIKEGKEFALFRGEVPKLGKAHIVIAGEEELHKINKRKDVPIMARPPLSSLTCPRELVYESKNRKDFHKEIYEMVSENVLEYVIPRINILFPDKGEMLINPSKMIRILRNEIAPLAEPNLSLGRKPAYLKKWNEKNAWTYTEDIICFDKVEDYLRKNSILIEKYHDLFMIKIPKIAPSIQEDRKKIFEWREKKLKPAIVTEFSELF